MKEGDKTKVKRAGVSSIWRRLGLVFGQPWIGPTIYDKTTARGRKLIGTDKDQEALEAFAAFFDKRAVMGRIIRRRNSTAIFDLIRLSEKYGPARQYLNNLADQIAAEIEAQKAGDEDISDWCTIVRHQGQFDKAWELYNKLLQDQPSGCSTAGKLANVVYPRLISEKRYKEALETAQENARWAIEELEPVTRHAEEQARLLTYWLPSVFEAFEVLLANNETALSEALEKWALQIKPNQAVYEGLIKAAQRADHSDVADRLSLAKNS